MFLKIDDKSLDKLIQEPAAKKAAEELKANVKNLKYDYESQHISAVVVDEQSTLDVNIKFDSTGEFSTSTCTCRKSEEAFVCKHILAALYMTKDKFLRKKNVVPVITQNTELLPKLKPWMNIREQRKKINCTAHNKYFFDCQSQPYVDVELKIGLERFYTIKDVRKLLDSVESFCEYPLGKVFSFDYTKHTLEEPYNRIIEFLLKIHKTEKALLRINEGHGFMWNSGTNPLSCFKGKLVRLGGDLLIEYFEILVGHDISFSFNDSDAADYKVIEEDVQVILNRSPAKEGMLLNVIFKDNIVPLMHDYSFVLDVEKHLVIKMPSEKKELLGRLFLEMSSTNSSAFIITKDYYEEFNGHIFPHLKKNNILIATTASSSPKRPGGLLARAHFDITRKGIVAGVRFCYGKTVINPFAEIKGVETYIVNRNQQIETMLLSILYKLGFEERSGRLIMEDEDKMIQFIKDDFAKIKNKFEYSTSEKYKSLKIICLENFSFELILKDGTTPSIKFNYTLEESEISELLMAANMNKKYYISKSGNLISLDNCNLRNAASLMSGLAIPIGDISNNRSIIPVNKLPFITAYLNEKEINNIKIQPELIDTINSLTNHNINKFDLPTSINTSLRDYQITGYNWLKILSRFHIGGILADDMGLGKTLQVLSFLRSELETCKLPSIVIAPTSLIYNWYDEAAKFVPDLKVLVIAGTKNERNLKMDELNNYDLIVTSFGLLKNDIDLYFEKEFNYCIVDEAQNIKNAQTLNSDSVKKIKAKCCFALTGTPVENNLTELWSIFDFVLPGHLPSYNKFVQVFERPISRDNDKQAAHKLSEYIRPFVLRRLKKDVLKELPDKIESVISTRMTPEQEKLYHSFLNKGIQEIKHHIKTTGFEKSRFEILALLTRLRQICSHPSLFLGDYPGGSGKLELLFDIIENSLKAEHRMLIFSQFSTMLDLIKAGIEERNIRYFSLDGKTPSSERTDMAKRFNEGESDIFLISLKAGGTGLNLTGADIVVHFDPWWNPAVEDQASDRAYRMGQTRAVQIIKLITHNTIEEKIYELQQRKKDLIESVIKSGEYLEDSLTEAEILEVLGIIE